MHKTFTRLLVIAVFLIIFSPGVTYGGFNRTTGLINIPKALTSMKEGELKKSVSAMFSFETPPIDINVNAALNYAINDKTEIGLTIFEDASARLNVHWQIWDGRQIFIALGAQNISLGAASSASASLFSPYIVTSVHVPRMDMYLHVGAGGGRFMKEGSTTAIPFFAGFEVPISITKLLIDYDGNYVNAGIQWNLSPSVLLNFAALRLNETQKGMAFCFGVDFFEAPAKYGLDEKIENEIMKRIEEFMLSQTILMQEGEKAPGAITQKGGVPGIETQDTVNNLAIEHADAATRYYFQGEYAKAIDELKMAIALNENIALFHLRIGSVYYKLGMVDSAIAEWEKALELNPNDTELREWLVTVIESRMERDLGNLGAGE